MKKLLGIFVICAGLGYCMAPAQAEAHEGFRHPCCYRGGGYGMGWVAPAVIGGVIGYELSQPRTVIVEQPPVYVQQPSVVYTQPPIPAGYHYQQMWNPQTNQYQMVLVPN